MDERRRVSSLQERQIAKKLGAKQHAGSGSGTRRNDMHTKSTLDECKTHLKGNRQVTLKADTVTELFKEAAIQDRIPVLHIRLAGRDLVVLDLSDYLELHSGG